MKERERVEQAAEAAERIRDAASVREAVEIAYAVKDEHIRQQMLKDILDKYFDVDSVVVEKWNENTGHGGYIKVYMNNITKDGHLILAPFLLKISLNKTLAITKIMAISGNFSAESVAETFHAPRMSVDCEFYCTYTEALERRAGILELAHICTRDNRDWSDLRRIAYYHRNIQRRDREQGHDTSWYRAVRDKELREYQDRYAQEYAMWFARQQMRSELLREYAVTCREQFGLELLCADGETAIAAANYIEADAERQGLKQASRF